VRHLPVQRLAGTLRCRNRLGCRGFSGYDAASWMEKLHHPEPTRLLQRRRHVVSVKCRVFFTQCGIGSNSRGFPGYDAASNAEDDASSGDNAASLRSMSHRNGRCGNVSIRCGFSIFDAAISLDNAASDGDDAAWYAENPHRLDAMPRWVRPSRRFLGRSLCFRIGNPCAVKLAASYGDISSSARTLTRDRRTMPRPPRSTRDRIGERNRGERMSDGTRSTASPAQGITQGPGIFGKRNGI
jgi:hypothetical protein